MLIGIVETKKSTKPRLEYALPLHSGALNHFTLYEVSDIVSLGKDPAVQKATNVIKST